MHKYIYIFVCTDINMHIHANVRLLNWTVRSSGIEQVNVYACVDVSKGMQGKYDGKLWISTLPSTYRANGGVLSVSDLRLDCKCSGYEGRN